MIMLFNNNFNSEMETYAGHSARKLTDEEYLRLKKDQTLISKFKHDKLESEARKNWDLFYKRNETRFFKDRHWTKLEFEELGLENNTNQMGEANSRPVLLEIGCGVGNLIFPLIEEKTCFYIQACDFSSRAIEFVKNHTLYSESSCHAFVCDVTEDELGATLGENSVDVATLIFVLSSIHPEKMLRTLNNIYKVLKPGGVVLLRDYGLFDQAMLRFSPGHKLRECFYVRQDGTRAYYFSKEMTSELFGRAGFDIVKNDYVTSQTVNKKENICVPRVFVQGKFQKNPVRL